MRFLEFLQAVERVIQTSSPLDDLLSNKFGPTGYFDLPLTIAVGESISAIRLETTAGALALARLAIVAGGNSSFLTREDCGAIVASPCLEPQSVHGLDKCLIDHSNPYLSTAVGGVDGCYLEFQLKVPVRADALHLYGPGYLGIKRRVQAYAVSVLTESGWRQIADRSSDDQLRSEMRDELAAVAFLAHHLRQELDDSKLADPLQVLHLVSGTARLVADTCAEGLMHALDAFRSYRAKHLAAPEPHFDVDVGFHISGIRIERPPPALCLSLRGVRILDDYGMPLALDTALIARVEQSGDFENAPERFGAQRLLVEAVDTSHYNHTAFRREGGVWLVELARPVSCRSVSVLLRQDAFLGLGLKTRVSVLKDGAWTPLYDGNQEMAALAAVGKLVDRFTGPSVSALVARNLVDLLDRSYDDLRRAYSRSRMLLHTVPESDKLAVVEAVEKDLNWCPHLPRMSFGRHAFARLMRDRDISSCVEALQRCIAAVRTAGFSAGVMYGTLLGARRDGTFIGYDDDIDIGVLVEAATAEADWKRLRSVLEAGDLRFHHDLSTDIVSVRVPAGREMVEMELFPVVHTASTGLVELYMEEMQKRTIPARIIGLFGGRVRLASVEVPAPADIDEFLRERYGASWPTPKRFFEI